MKKLPLSIALVSLCVVLAGCGNKGALIRASEAPAAAKPGAEQPAAVEAPASDATSEPETSSGTPAAYR